MSDVTCVDGRTASHATKTENEQVGSAWTAVVSLSLGVFGLVTAEFLPASLLTPIASDLGISNGAAGQTVTATALVAAVAGPAVVIGSGRTDRRMIVWGLSLLLVISNLLAAVASHVAVLLVARIALGVALGGFWSLAAALTLRLVPPRMLPRAMSIIFTGVSAATVCAAPVGAYLGDVWGWRATFMIAAGIGALALVAQILTMPKLPPIGAPSLGTFLVLLRRPNIRIGLIVVLLAVSGHFSGFTYLRPFLEQIPKLDVEMISLALLAFGVGGFFGNLAGGFVAERSSRLAVTLASLLMATMAFALVGYGTSIDVSFVAAAIWGFAFCAFPVGISTWTTQSAPDHAESAGALLVTTFQIAIAAGAVFGGLLVDGLGSPGAITYCGVATLLGGLAMAAFARSPER